MSVLNPVIGSIDNVNKLIYLSVGTRTYHPVDDIYKEIRTLRRLDESLRKFDIPVKAEGSVPKGGGKYTPRYAIFQNGWQVVPEDINHSLFISGEQITDDGNSGPACINTNVLSLGTSVIIQYEPPAAELIKAEDELIAIQRMAFDEVITVNKEMGISGITWPMGTLGKPVNNLEDALLISKANDINTISIVTNMEIDHGGDYRGMTFIGASKTKTTMDVSEISQVNNCEFYDAHITGTLDGDATLKNCLIDNLNYVTGFIEECVLDAGVILLGNGATAHFLNCWSGVPGSGTPKINMGGAGQSLAMRNYNGGIEIVNKTGTESVSLDMNSGQVKIDLETVINGTIIVRGIGKVIESSTGEYLSTGYYGSLYIVNEAMSKENISIAVWDEPLKEHIIKGSTGNSMAHSAFENLVHINTITGTDTVDYPAGTVAYPCKTIENALAILNNENNVGSLIGGNLTGEVYVPYKIGRKRLIGKSRFDDIVHTDGGVFTKTTFVTITVTGAFNGEDVYFKDSILKDIDGLSGEAIGCRLMGIIKIGKGRTFSATDCIAEGDSVTIDMQNTPGTTFSIDSNSGTYEFINCVEGCYIDINMKGGEIYLDESCTGGDLYLEGTGNLYNTSNMNIIENHLLSLKSIADSTWSYEK